MAETISIEQLTTEIQTSYKAFNTTADIGTHGEFGADFAIALDVLEEALAVQDVTAGWIHFHDPANPNEGFIPYIPVGINGRFTSLQVRLPDRLSRFVELKGVGGKRRGMHRVFAEMVMTEASDNGAFLHTILFGVGFVSVFRKKVGRGREQNINIIDNVAS